MPINLVGSAALGARLRAVEGGHVFVTTLSTSTGAAATNKTIIDNALAAASAAGGGIVFITQAGFFYTNGGHIIPVGVEVWGLRTTHLVNRAATYTFQMTDVTSGGPKCGLRFMRIHGALSGVPAIAGGVGVEFGNGYGFAVEEVFVDGFYDAGVGFKFHCIDTGNIDTDWTGGHNLHHVSAVNCSKCFEFVADAGAAEWLGDFDISDALIQPYASQVGISIGKSFFYNNRITGGVVYAGDNAIGIELTSANSKVRGSFFDLRGELLSAGFTSCKRIKITVDNGQFDAEGKFFVMNGSVPNSWPATSVFNFVEYPYSYYESQSTHLRTVASAGTIWIPGGSDFFKVTGTTTITVIGGQNSWDGRVVTLKFEGAITVAVSGNVKLTGGADKAFAANDTLTLAHDASTGIWYECVSPIQRLDRQIFGGAATAAAGFGAWLTAKARSTGTEAAFFQKFSSGQTAHILTIGDETGNTYFSFNKEGFPISRKVAAIADGDLSSNELAYWFEPTTGAAKLKLKGKDAGGTVRVGEVPLAFSAIPSVASATATTLPSHPGVVTVTGTTTITSVTAGAVGERVTLIFSGILTFTDGSNLKLAGNLVTTADDTITLVCDGTNWYETGRSVN